MQRVYDFLKKAKVYFLATTEGEQPHVRPMGTLGLIDGRIYFQTDRSKAVSRQMDENPRIEICAMADLDWIRIKATVVRDDRAEIKEQMQKQNPDLQYNEQSELLYLRDAAAVISSFTSEAITICF